MPPVRRQIFGTNQARRVLPGPDDRLTRPRHAEARPTRRRSHAHRQGEHAHASRDVAEPKRAAGRAAAAQPRDLRAEGERRVPQLFMHSDHAKWSAYAASQLGARQGSTGPPIEEAIALEPKLAAELQQLFARAREQMPPSGGAAGSDISSELEGDMARAAATSLQAALLELLDAAEADVPHVWADEAPAAALRVRAYMRGWPRNIVTGQKQALGRVSLLR